MPIKNAIYSQQVYDPTDESIMAEQELCMERLYDYNYRDWKINWETLYPQEVSLC